LEDKDTPVLTLLTCAVRNLAKSAGHISFISTSNQKTKVSVPDQYPDAIAKFVFDQSSAHGAFAKDALNTKDMNVRPGEKQQIIHNTFISHDNPNPTLHGAC